MPLQLDEWGFLSPVGYQPLTSLVTQGQNLIVDPGETVQISWADGLSGDWLMLFLPTDIVYDYVQWGAQGPANIYFLQYNELETVWPGGNSTFVDAMPPYSYIGKEGMGWTNGAALTCLATSRASKWSVPPQCDPGSNSYDLTFQVNWVGGPETGGLTVNEAVLRRLETALTSTITLPANGIGSVWRPPSTTSPPARPQWQRLLWS